MAAGYGLAPDPWQRLVLDGWLGVREDGRWSSPRCGLAVPRQNGKNGVAEVRELFGMVGLAERILHTAHEVKTARKAFARLLEFFDNERQYPELRSLVREIRRTNGQEAIVLRNGGSVEFIARSKGSGRGFSADVLLMDEAQDLSDDTLAALSPTISASDNPQQVMMGTPPGPTVTGEVFSRTREAGLKGQDPRLCWLEWGCEGAVVDLDSPQTWLAANPALGIRLREETISDERASMDDETFARERLGMWTTVQRNAVIDPAVWAALSDPDSSALDPIAFAVDVTPDRSFASIAMAGRRSDGLLHVEVVDNRKGTGWVGDRLTSLIEKWQSCAVVIDTAGPAGSLLPALQERGIEPLIMTGRTVGNACGAFYDAVVDGRLRHLDDPRLNSALAVARKRVLGDAWAWHRRDSGSDITPLVAVTFALHGYVSTPPPVTRSKAAFAF